MPNIIDRNKPIGTSQCLRCKQIWDGSETYIDSNFTSAQLTCGNLFCGANVRKISELPKVEYAKSLENKTESIQ